MKAIYFPYTYVQRETMEAIRTCLGSFVVYQPSERDIPDVLRQWVADKLIELRIPTFGDDDRLDFALKEYHQWATLHSGKQGIDLNYLRHHHNRPPFFDDTASSQIRSDIKRRLDADAARSENGSDDSARLLEARIYLSIAQQHDIQSESVQKDMQRVNDLEKTLLKDLKGDNHTTGESSIRLTGGYDQQDYMLSQRIEAWSQLLLTDTVKAESEGSGLFVTSSRTAIEQVVESQSQVETLVQIDGIPVVESTESTEMTWQSSIVDILSSLAIGGRADQIPQDLDLQSTFPKSKSTGKKASLSVYMVPGKQPIEVFDKYINRYAIWDDALQLSEKINNTIFCAVGSHSN